MLHKKLFTVILFIFHLGNIVNATTNHNNDDDDTNDKKTKNKEGIEITRKYPRYFKDELIKVTLYHELIVQQRLEHVNNTEAINACSDSIKKVKDKIHEIVGDPVTFADPFNNLFPGLSDITKELSQLEGEISFDAATNVEKKIFNNKILLDFAQNVDPLKVHNVFDDIATTADDVVVGKIKQFNFGIFTIYLKAQSYQLFQCAEIVLREANSVENVKRAIQSLNSSISTISTELQMKLKPQPIVANEKGKKTKTTGLVKAQFVRRDYSEKPGFGCNSSCSAIDGLQSFDDCANPSYCAETDLTSLQYSLGNDAFYYGCIIASNGTTIKEAEECESLGKMESKCTLCKCSCLHKKFKVQLGESLSNVTNNEFISGIQLRRLSERQNTFSLIYDVEFTQFQPLKNFKYSKTPISGKHLPDTKLQEYESIKILVDNISTPPGTVITGIRLKPNPIQIEVRYHAFDFINGKIVGDEKWSEVQNTGEKVMIPFKLHYDNNPLLGDIEPFVVNEKLEMGFPLSSISFNHKQQDSVGEIIAPSITEFDISWYIVLEDSYAFYEMKIPILTPFVIAMSSGSLALFVLLSILYLLYKRKPRYDTPPASTGSTPQCSRKHSCGSSEI